VEDEALASESESDAPTEPEEEEEGASAPLAGASPRGGGGAAGGGASPARAVPSPASLRSPSGWSPAEIAALKAALARLPRPPPKIQSGGENEVWAAAAARVGTGRSANSAYDVYLALMKGGGASGGGAAEAAWQATRARFLAARAPPPWSDAERAALAAVLRAPPVPIVESDPSDGSRASIAAWSAIASALAARCAPVWGAPRSAGACYRRWKRPS
jgi:hypothetical protein